MKKTILLSVIVLFTSITVFAKKQNYIPIEIFLKTGEVKNGYAERLNSGYDDYVSFKKNEGAEVEKIESFKIKKMAYKIDGKIYEYWFLNCYKGWGQKKIGNPKWLNLIKEGYVNLYKFNTQMNVGFGSISSSNFTDYYCLREQEGEKAAKWISAVAGANNNQMFRAKAPLYFADYPELAKKIKDKEYKWNDLYEVIDIYNKWKQ